MLVGVEAGPRARIVPIVCVLPKRRAGNLNAHLSFEADPAACRGATVRHACRSDRSFCAEPTRLQTAHHAPSVVRKRHHRARPRLRVDRDWQRRGRHARRRASGHHRRTAGLHERGGPLVPVPGDVSCRGGLQRLSMQRGEPRSQGVHCSVLSRPTALPVDLGLPGRASMPLLPGLLAHRGSMRALAGPRRARAPPLRLRRRDLHVELPRSAVRARGGVSVGFAIAPGA